MKPRNQQFSITPKRPNKKRTAANRERMQELEKAETYIYNGVTYERWTHRKVKA